MKPIIGIVGRPEIDNDGSYDIAIVDYYRKAIIKVGGIPILILPPQLIIQKQKTLIFCLLQLWEKMI